MYDAVIIAILFVTFTTVSCESGFHPNTGWSIIAVLVVPIRTAITLNH